MPYLVDGAADDVVAGRLCHRRRLASQHGLVHKGVARDHLAIRWQT